LRGALERENWKGITQGITPRDHSWITQGITQRITAGIKN